MVSNTGSDLDDNDGDFGPDDASDEWQPDPEVSSGVLAEFAFCCMFECVCNGGIERKQKLRTISKCDMMLFELSYDRRKLTVSFLYSLLLSRTARKPRRLRSERQRLRRLPPKKRSPKKKNPRRNLKTLRMKRTKTTRSLTRTKRRTNQWTR